MSGGDCVSAAGRNVGLETTSNSSTPRDSRPSASATYAFLLLLAAGAVLRFTYLERRPLHGDEAGGAAISSEVGDSGSFVYALPNSHGPFQYFLGGGVMRLAGESTFWIRFPYALVGSLLPLACLGLRRPLGDTAWLLACSLLTFSPTFLYYSRYAIQEVDFAVATAALLSFGAWFARSGRTGALVGTCLAAAWMVTVKETFVIVWACLAMALGMGALLGGQRFRDRLMDVLRYLVSRWRSLALGASLGGVVVLGAYSDCFRDATGLRNLAQNMAQMLRTGGSSASTVELHRHPPGFYAGLVLRYEWLVAVLSVAGAWAALRTRRPMLVFLTLYAALVTGVHCALTYKTPWLLITPLLPLALLAGAGGAALLGVFAVTRGARFQVAAAALLPLLSLPDAIRSSFLHPADPSEGLAYHHAGPEQEQLALEIHAIISRVPDDVSPKVVICLPHVWPLAWYLRDEPDVAYQGAAAPQLAADDLRGLPALVTLERADPRFVRAFLHTDTVPPFEIPGYKSRRVVLIPPDYMVARLWVRPDLASADLTR